MPEPVAMDRKTDVGRHTMNIMYLEGKKEMASLVVMKTQAEHTVGEKGNGSHFLKHCMEQ
jgi:hypothetical protein